MQIQHVKSFSRKKFLIGLIALIVTLLIDTSVVKINDLVDKFFIPMQGKLILFAVNSSLILILQYFLIKYIENSFESIRLRKSLRVKVIYMIFKASLGLLAVLIGALIFQMFYYSYYYTSISIAIILLSYGIAAALIIFMSLSFFSWYRSNHSLIVCLYFIAMLGIAFNLVMTAAFVAVKVNDRPNPATEYVGSSGDVSGGKYESLESIWITTAILMNSYREKLVNAIVYWVILSIPLVYFLITFFYQFLLANFLSSYLAIDPVSVSIILAAFVSLSKPIGGLLFGVAFWKISRIVSYERNIRAYMFISGWGIFLIFSANQAATQIVAPYPPFGLATITVLVMAAFLMLLGIYNSAIFVSANNELRKSIYRHAVESRLLRLIGQAEMESEIEKTVRKISKDKNILQIDTEQRQLLEIDENGLKKYLDLVIKEVKKVDENNH